MNGMERLARAERDCVELHKSLAEAIKRMSAVRREYTDPRLRIDDLLEVLERTAQPETEG